MWARTLLVLLFSTWSLSASSQGIVLQEQVERASSPSPDKPQGLSACPVESMSCYPGCATVGDTYACGKALVLLAGGLRAAIESIARDEGLSLEDFCEKYAVLCAKGGKQNIENEYVRRAKELPRNVDPCEWLMGLYREAIARDDTVEAQKLKKAQKALGCRPNANDY